MARKKEVVDPANKLVDELMDRYGVKIHRGAETDSYTRVIPTGIPPFDLASGIGGLPGGKMIEFWGPESGGKTAFGLHCIGYMQRTLGERAFFGNLENDTTGKWMRTIGIQDDLLHRMDGVPLNPKKDHVPSGEIFLDVLYDLIDSEKYGIILVDSLPKIESEASFERGLDRSQMVAENAKLYKRGFGRCVTRLARTETCMILINQLTFKIGRMIMDPETQPGGQSLKHLKPMSVKFRRGKSKKKSNRVVGHDLAFKFKKNKFARPEGGGEVFLNYDTGFDVVSPLLLPAVERGIIRGGGRSWTFDGVTYEGQDEIQSAIAADDTLFKKLWDQIQASGGLSSRVDVEAMDADDSGDQTVSEDP